MDIVRSEYSLVSNILAVYMVFLYSHTNYKYVYIIPILFHFLRYYKYFDRFVTITKLQKNLILLAVFDYILIIFHERMNTKVLGIISGLISVYFVYDYYNDKQVNRNYTSDIYMLLVSITLIYLNPNDNYMVFASIREIVYHLLEWILIYN